MRRDKLPRRPPPSTRMARPVLEMIEATSAPCGGCTACCTTHGIPELNKPPGEGCRHACPSGCAIYGRRPGSCRAFACAWKLGVAGSQDEADRPDRLGVVIDASQGNPERPSPVLFELWPGAARDGRVGELAAHLCWMLDTMDVLVKEPGGRTVAHLKVRPRRLPDDRLSPWGVSLARRAAAMYRKQYG